MLTNLPIPYDLCICNIKSVYHGLMTIQHSAFNVKAPIDTFNQAKALEGALSVIVKLQTSRKFVSSSSIQASHCSRTQVNLAATPAPSTNPPNPGRWWSGSPRSVTFYNVETNPILLVRQSTAVNFVHSDDLLEETRE